MALCAFLISPVWVLNWITINWPGDTNAMRNVRTANAMMKPRCGSALIQTGKGSCRGGRQHAGEDELSAKRPAAGVTSGGRAAAQLARSSAHDQKVRLAPRKP